jgi:hypothetical protein
LNSIRIPAVMNNQMVAITGAVERYFRKYCICYLLQKRMQKIDLAKVNQSTSDILWRMA